MSAAASRGGWSEAAVHWIRHADRIAAMTRPASDALLAALAPAPGLDVLDVASGVGDPALRIAAAVGPRGSVLATDEVAVMLETLAARAAERGLTQVRTRPVAAERLDLEACADRVSCRFGAMFFEDPGRALAAMHRAARPGGRLALVVWGRREANPYFTGGPSVLDAHGVPPDPDAPARTVFAWSEPGALAARVRASGWRHVDEHVHRFTMALPDVPPAGLLDWLREMSRTVRARTGTLDETELARLRGALSIHATPFARDGGLAFPAECYVVTATA